MPARTLPEALDDLLTRWRARRAAALADAIERLSAAAPRAAAPATQEEWTARAANVAPTDGGELAALTTPSPGALKAKLLDDTAERLRALRRLMPDPRVARALVDFVREVPFTSNSSQRLWSEIFDLVVEAGDPRAHAWLDGIFAGKQIRDAMREWLDEQAAATRARLAEAFPDGADLALDKKSAAELAALVEQLAPIVPEAPAVTAQRRAAAATAKSRDELLAAVYAAPDDDAPRLVLADVLQEAGDPRGEFIALQCRRAPDDEPSAREIALEKQHGRAWLGELERFVQLSGRSAPRFRRGFVAAAALKYKSKQDAGFARDLPGWATVEELELNYDAQALPRTLRAVRAIGNVHTDGLRALLERPDLRPAALGFTWLLEDHELWRALEASPVAERLVELTNVPPAFLAPSPLLPRLRRVAWDQRVTPTDEHLALAAAHPSLRLAFSTVVGELEIARDADGLLGARLTVRAAPHEYALKELTQVGHRTLQTLTVDGKPQDPTKIRTIVESWVASLAALRVSDLTAIGGARRAHTPTVAAFEVAAATTRDDARGLTDAVDRLDWTQLGLVVTHENAVVLVDAERGTIRARHVVSTNASVQTTPDGQVLLELDGGLTFMDPRDGKHARTLASTPAPELLSHDGRFGWSRKGGVVELATGAARPLPKTRGYPIAVDDAGERCLALDSGALLLYPIGGPRGAQPRALGTVEGDRGWNRFSADGARLLRVERDATVRVLDAATGAPLWSAIGRANDDDETTDVSDAAGALGVGTYEQATVYDQRTGAVRARGTGVVRRLALSPDGTRLAIANHERLVVIDLATSRRLWEIPVDVP